MFLVSAEPLQNLTDILNNLHFKINTAKGIKKKKSIQVERNSSRDLRDNPIVIVIHLFKK